MTLVKQKLILVCDETASYGKKIKGPADVANLLREIGAYTEPEEVVNLICLSGKGDVIGVHEIARGSISEAVVQPREIFKRAILNNAHAIILAHNHPSGSAEPSQVDIEMTDRIRQAGKILGIALYDHVIVTPYGDMCSIAQDKAEKTLSAKTEKT